LRFYYTLGWTNNLPALGILYAAFTAPRGCWTLTSSFDIIPNKVIDASRLDGRSLFGVLW